MATPKKLIEAVLRDDALLADIESCRAAASGFRLWWLGQSGFLLQWAGHHLLIDPYLSDSLTRKYAATDKPHVRMTELVIAPELLSFAEAVTSSHNHTDHLDGETLVPLLAANPELTVVVPEANRDFAAKRLGVDPARLTGVDAGGCVTAGCFDIRAVPAAHEEIERDEVGRCRFLGYVIRFGDWAIYHSGDTVLYDSMIERLRPQQVDVAVLPINGSAPERRVAGNLWGREAASLAADIGARLVIPCHYDMFTFNTSTPEEFTRECERLGQAFRVLRCGERWASEELPSIR